MITEKNIKGGEFTEFESTLRITVSKPTKLVHCQQEKYDVYIGRPSKWGNPYTHIKTKNTLAKFIVNTREEAIECYKKWFLEQENLLKDIEELRGKTLGCWCCKANGYKEGDKIMCHGQILIMYLQNPDLLK